MKNCVAAGAFGIAVVLWSERRGGRGWWTGGEHESVYLEQGSQHLGYIW